MIVHYVAGYGRSGSTTLGRVVAQQHAAVGIGEVAALADGAFVESARCSCGRGYAECPYWTSVEAALRGGGSPLPSIGPWEGLPGLVLPMVVLRRIVRRRAASARHRDVSYAAGVAALLGAADGAVVDTSKTTRRTANRPRLLRASGADVRLWLPWRPVRAVIASHRSAQRRAGRSGAWWRSAVAVVPSRAMAFVATAWCAASLRRRPRLSPLERTLAELEALPQADPVEHLIAGNRNRHQNL